jgi:hypothetical protein
MIHCENCGKTITSKEDVNILLFLFVFPKAFCNNCYSSKERGFSRHILYIPQHPINSKAYVFGLWFSTFMYIAIILFFYFSNSKLDEILENKNSLIFLFTFIFLIWGWIIRFIVKRSLSGLQ